MTVNKYEPVYERLALAGRVVIANKGSINAESIRVGWYKFRKENSIVLGSRANMVIRVVPVNNRTQLEITLQKPFKSGGFTTVEIVE